MTFLTVASVMLYLKSTMQMNAKPESSFFSNCAQLERKSIFPFPFQTASPCGPSGTEVNGIPPEQSSAYLVTEE